jgi:hypothetical protein
VPRGFVDASFSTRQPEDEMSPMSGDQKRSLIASEIRDLQSDRASTINQRQLYAKR